MNDLGAFIIILIIASQAVAAIVAAVKKRQKAAQAPLGSQPTASTSPPKPASPKTEAASRAEVLDRRRTQLEDLRARAKAQRTAKAQTAGGTAPRTPQPPPVPQRVIIDERRESPAAAQKSDKRVTGDVSAYAKRRRFQRSRDLRAMLHRPARLRQVIIMKELLDPPIALRNPADSGD